MTKIEEIINSKKKDAKQNTKGKPIIVFDGVEKRFNEKKIFENVSFSIPEGSITSLIGSSGIGKTTTIRIMNGLEEYNGGKVIIDGTLLTKKTKKKIRKQTAFVFQQFNLFSNMSVMKNIIYTPINVYKQNKEKVEKEAKNLLKKFNLSWQAEKYPHELSGGQKQRVAIIRALILRPKILIMDEPTASLDPDLIKDLIDTIKDINKQYGLTIVIVSHDMFFVESCSDKIIRFSKEIKRFQSSKVSNVKGKITTAINRSVKYNNHSKPRTKVKSK